MRRSALPLSRRSLVQGSLAAAALCWTDRLDATDDVQPLARRSGFPQMPTGFTGVTPCGSYAPPTVIASSGRIAPASEPGAPLEISGTVYAHDRRTPASGIILFAYHTDRNGQYNAPNTPFRPRLYGWVKSDAHGRYAFRTIKPAPYPRLDTPAHIHVSLFGPALPEYWVDDYWFAGDPLIDTHQRSLLTGRGGGGETLALSMGANGVLRGRRDFALEKVPVSGGCRLLHA